MGAELAPYGWEQVCEIDEALRAASLEEGGEDPHSGGLSASKVLLVHSGGDSQRSPTQCVCGKAWSALNSCGNNHSTAIGDESCNTPMDLLLDHLFRLFSAGAELPPGSLVVTACDVMLLIPTSVAASADWSLWSGANSGGASGSVAGLAIAADAGKYAPNHGVYCLAEEGKHGSGVDGDQTCGVMGVSRYLQKPSVEVAEKAGAFLPPHQHQVQSELVHPLQPEVAIDTGVVVFSGKATAALVRMASSEPFKGCTSRGVEEGAAALRLELYSDLLLALRTDATGDEGTGGFEAYIAACGAAVSPDEPLFKARLDIWDALSGFPLGAMLLRGATFVHLGTTPELLDMMTLRLPTFVEPYGLTTRAGCAVGRACSVEDDPPAVIVNSNLQGAGVVAGGSVVEHCLLQGDGWEVGAGCLVSGVRSLRADFRLRLRAGMCIQQTDLGSEEDVVLDEGDGGEDEPDEDEEEGEQNERETGSDGNEDEQQGGDEGEEDEEEEQDEGGDGEDDSKSFVVSIFAVGDDIKAHYTKPTATFCGATWSKFLGYTGATAEDIWGDVPEAARTLWSAKLFPVHTPSEDEGQGTGKCSGNDFAAAVLWVQDVRDTDTDTDTSLPTPPTSMGIDQQYASAALIKSWLSAERLSFKDILRRADPSKEFQWRRRLQKEIASGTNDAGGNGAVCR